MNRTFRKAAIFVRWLKRGENTKDWVSDVTHFVLQIRDIAFCLRRKQATKRKKNWFNITNHTCSASPHSSFAFACSVMRSTAEENCPLVDSSDGHSARSYNTVTDNVTSPFETDKRIGVSLATLTLW